MPHRASGRRSASGPPRRPTTHLCGVVETALAHVVQNKAKAADTPSDLFPRHRRLLQPQNGSRLPLCPIASARTYQLLRIHHVHDRSRPAPPVELHNRPPGYGPVARLSSPPAFPRSAAAATLAEVPPGPRVGAGMPPPEAPPPGLRPLPLRGPAQSPRTRRPGPRPHPARVSQHPTDPTTCDRIPTTRPTHQVIPCPISRTERHHLENRRC